MLRAIIYVPMPCRPRNPHDTHGPYVIREVPFFHPVAMNYVHTQLSIFLCIGHQRNSLKLVDSTLRLLDNIKKPIAVLSITGPCRTGKSYVLSRLLGSPDAFDLGHTFDPKTFGIWMGTSALVCDDYVTILLDTEGIDAVSADATNDASILVLTILLSSHFIYNSVNVPMKNDLEKMR